MPLSGALTCRDPDVPTGGPFASVSPARRRHAGGMSATRAASDKRHVAWARVLVVAGAVTTLASAVVGYLWLHRMPGLQAVDFGQRVQFAATESASATIFASTGLSRPPSCEVTSGSGEAVTVGEAEHYHQGGGLESAFGFPVTSGTTYTVTCSATETGRFAVAQDADVPEGLFIAAGSLGLVMCGVGGVLIARQRRAINTRSDSTR